MDLAENTAKYVPENIAKYLTDRGISKSHVSNRSGIPKPRMSALTTGKGKMTLAEYLAICKALDVKPTQFLGG